MSEVKLDLLVRGLTQAVRLRSSRTGLGGFSRDRMKAEELRELGDKLGELFVKVSTDVLASKVFEDHHTYRVRHPATWWQHLKYSLPERVKAVLWPWWSPLWWMKTGRVRYAETVIKVNLTRYDTFPRADVVLPPDEFGCPVQFDQYESLVTSRWDVAETASGVSPGRRYVKQRDLVSLLTVYLSEKGVSPYVDMSFGMYRVMEALMAALPSFGVNPDELVRWRSVPASLSAEERQEATRDGS